MPTVATQVNHRFNVRAYGIWLNAQNQVLVADEMMHGHPVTKFPGGGLEFGEGLLDCLQREWMEELGIAPEVIRHYYTTDFFQPSAVAPREQVLSVYYLVRIALAPEDVRPQIPGLQLRWVSMAELDNEILTLPIDKHVGKLLRHDFGSMPNSTESA